MVTPADPLPGPSADLPGLDPAWSRWVQAPDADGIERRWHLLTVDRTDDAPSPVGTMLLVHGNPTWSYLWRRFLAAARPGWRVLAVDQLGMGWSDHPTGTLEHPRGLASRIEDLDRLTDTLGILDPSGAPVVAVGHDWGGIIVSGWASRHPERIGGLVLANTAVAHDFSAGLPVALRVARHPAALRAACVTTPGFVRAATAVSSPRPSPEVRAAYAAPYRTAAERDFVGQFVADIPLEADHPSRTALDEVAAGLERLRDVPALLLRGPKDPVFGEEHLRDLRRRLPQADVQRYEGTGHLVVEDAPQAPQDVWDWGAARVEPAGDTSDTDSTAPPAPEFAVGTSAVPWARLLQRADETPDALAVAEVGTDRRITFAELETLIEQTARGLRAAGIAPGDRVAMLVPPGIDLTVVVYACWRLGAVIVVADKGLGLAGMGRALRGAGPAHVIGRAEGLAAARAMRVPGQRVLVGNASTVLRPVIAAHQVLDELRAEAKHTDPVTVEINGDTECAILFTSGATGPSKGVVYRVDALRTMIGHIGHAYGLGPEDRLVAAFAPFALYGPALGIGAVVPDVDVTRPASLTAVTLADAVAAADATAVFASPGALRSVVATADQLDDRRRKTLSGVRLLLSAGAPVPSTLLREVATVLPRAAAHTPYGMTEALPVADIDLPGIEAAEAEGALNGVCVGRPLDEVQVAIVPFAEVTSPVGDLPPGLTSRAHVSGEILVRGAHVKDRYDQLWRAQQDSTAVPGWHRTGDVGHLDEQGQLWVEGRAVHVVHTADGPVTPVAGERAAEEIVGVRTACVAGVGPKGAQQVAVVLVLDDHHRRHAPGPVAPVELTDRVRESIAYPVAAVLVTDSVPVDIRHESKIDRTAVSRWAERVLAGGRVGTP